MSSYPLHTYHGRGARHNDLIAAYPHLTFVPHNDDEAVVITGNAVERRPSPITA